MNMAIRAIAIESFRARKKRFQITLKGFGTTLLVAGILLSAFSIVYVKDLNRRLFIQYQNLETEKAQSLVQSGKLLLEESTWSTQSRIQQIAQRQLGMVVPSAKNIILVERSDASATTR